MTLAWKHMKRIHIQYTWTVSTCDIHVWVKPTHIEQRNALKSINQSINQSIIQPTNQSIHQSKRKAPGSENNHDKTDNPYIVVTKSFKITLHVYLVFYTIFLNVIQQRWYCYSLKILLLYSSSLKIRKKLILSTYQHVITRIHVVFSPSL